MAENLDNQKLLQDLVDAGFEKDLAEKAIDQAAEKNFDCCVEYITCLQAALEERKRRKDNEEIDIMKEKRQAEELDKEMREKEKQKIVDKEYLNSLREKIEADKKEREEKDNQTYLSSDIMKSSTQKIEAGKDDCRIRIRYEDGVSRIYTLNKMRDLNDLFDIAKEYLGCKNAVFCDTNFVEIKNETKTLEKAGFWPTKILIAKKK